MELYPECIVRHDDPKGTSFIEDVNSVLRDVYIGAWEDMEEVNTYTAEYVKASKLRKEYSEATNIKDRGIYHYSEWLEAKIEADTELREAAEKVVEVYESDAYADDIIELLNPLEELEKALK